MIQNTEMSGKKRSENTSAGPYPSDKAPMHQFLSKKIDWSKVPNHQKKYKNDSSYHPNSKTSGGNKKREGHLCGVKTLNQPTKLVRVSTFQASNGNHNDRGKSRYGAKGVYHIETSSPRSLASSALSKR